MRSTGHSRPTLSASLPPRKVTILGVVMALVMGVAGFGIAPAAAAGTTFTVNTTNDTHLSNPSLTSCVDTGAACSLRAAIEAANNIVGSPVTIMVPAGTYNLTLQTALVVGRQANQNISIVGALATTTVVNASQPSSCTATPATCVQVFQLDSDGVNPVAGVNVTISGLTISGGRISGTNANIVADAGAGVGAGGPVGAKTVTTLVNDIISNNQIVGTATNAPGGGVSSAGGDLTITNCTFSGNSSGSSNGGAIDFESFDGNADTLTVTGSTFSGNTSSNRLGGGGAIYMAANGTASTANISTSTFTGNLANGDGTGSVAASGGGAILQDGGTLVANSNSFVTNSTTGAVNVGGAVDVLTGTATMAANRFVGNTDGVATGGTLAANTGASIAANDNWWASNTGPTVAATAGTVTDSLYLVLRVAVSTNPVAAGLNTTVTADLTHDQSNSLYNTNFVLPSGATFDSTAGTYGGGTAGTWAAGQVTDVLTAGTTAGAFPAGAKATIDGVAVQASVTVLNPPVPPSITSADNTTFHVGTPGTFAVTTATTTEFPLPTLSDNGATLPTGVTFHDNGNGTATLAGTPAAATGGTYPFTITAHSTSAPDATQSFTLTVNQSPSISSAAGTTFTVGSLGTFPVTTGPDFPTATTLSKTGALPTGVTFVDGGSGTATLAGTPAAGTGGTYPLTVTAANSTLPNAVQSFVLTVNEAPSITSASSVTFQAGTEASFPITTGGFPHPTLADGSAILPAGLTFVDNTDGTATLAGTPAAGSGGTYPFTITAHNATEPDATQSFTLTVNEAPSISSADATTFTAGTAGTFTIATGHMFPVPTLSDGDAALPTGISFTDNGDGTATLAGTPVAGSGGSYTFTVTAANGITPDATQSFTLTVNEAPSITSANSATFTVGSSGTLLVTTGGFPHPTVTESGALPGGVTWVDDLDGTATLAGIPAAGSGGSYSLIVTAHNTTSPDATQTLTLTVAEAATITSPNAATFAVGTAGTFTVTTGPDFPALTTLSDGAATLPAGVTFTDNGDGTATLSGTPATGTGGLDTFTITAVNGVGIDATQLFTLTVLEVPSITSSNAVTFKVGTEGSFTVTTGHGFPTPSVLSESGALPAGVSFVNVGDGTATLAGTPTASSGGSYPLTVTAANSTLPNAVQSFVLTVLEAPAITSPASTTFTVGAAGTFTVTTAHNFPLATALSIGAGVLPTGVTFVDNGDGTATLAGTPAVGSGEVYSFTITAANSTLPNAVQPFVLTVLEAPAITSPASTSFTVGAAGTFTVTTAHNFPLATALSIGAGVLPIGVTFVDNGDGTATLAGSPAVGSGEVYSFTITAANSTLPNAVQPFVLTVLEAPAITSPASTSFTVGAAGTFTVTTAHNFPLATALSIGAGVLPTGVTFVDNGTGAATLAGTPAPGTGGTYPLTVTAANSTLPNAVQSFVLTVNEAPAITSPASTTFTAGTVGTFTVTTAHDFPAVTELSIGAGVLPAGVTFVDNGDGTATLAGTPAVGSGQVYSFTITAANLTAPDATQGFVFTVNEAPAITSVAATSFAVGTAGTFTVTTAHNFPLATTLSIGAGVLPSGVTFTDNGNGTATLAGTPAVGTGGSFQFTITAANLTAPDATQSFTLTVIEAPAITSVAATTFTVGMAGTFTVTTAHDFPALTSLSDRAGCVASRCDICGQRGWDGDVGGFAGGGVG